MDDKTLKIRNLESIIKKQQLELEELQTAIQVYPPLIKQQQTTIVELVRVLRIHNIQMCVGCMEWGFNPLECTLCKRVMCHNCKSVCYHCHHDYCSDCYKEETHRQQCARCEVTTCLTSKCNQCNKYACNNCNQPCADCGQDFCPNCFVGCLNLRMRCRNCHYNYCTTCYTPTDWQLLSPARQTNTMTLLLVLLRLKPHISYPPRSIRHIILQYVILNTKTRPTKMSSKKPQPRLILNDL